MNNVGMIKGKQVVIAKTCPRIQLSADCPVSDKFREEFNGWLLGFFGIDFAIPRGVIYFIESQNSIVVHPEDYAMLKERCI